MGAFFDNIFNSPYISTFTVEQFLLVMISAVFVGMLISVVYAYNNEYSEGFLITVAIIPAVVAVIIMVVSDSIGMGIAVAGAFSLVRFRSVPGKATEIGAIFIAMASGLLIGTGYLGFSILFVMLIGFFYVAYERLSGRELIRKDNRKTLNVTIPESLNYTGLFDSVLKKYATDIKLTKVRTTNMGSMFRLTYELVVADDFDSKALVDEIRVMNGNLEVSVSDTKETEWQSL